MNIEQRADRIIETSNKYVVRPSDPDSFGKFSITDKKTGVDMSAKLDKDSKREIVYNDMIRNLCSVKKYSTDGTQDSYDKIMLENMLPNFDVLAAMINKDLGNGSIDTQPIFKYFDECKFKYTDELIRGMFTSSISYGPERFLIFANYHNNNPDIKRVSDASCKGPSGIIPNPTRVNFKVERAPAAKVKLP
ncbi:MAG: hypothetical protein FWE53_00540 [Firmicutes bacterium]|nr:hypothetical protein [Bacillota bacterium]